MFVVCLWPPVGRRNEDPVLPASSQVDKPGMIRHQPHPRLCRNRGGRRGCEAMGNGSICIRSLFVGQSYLHDMKEAKGKKSATLHRLLPQGYEVQDVPH